MFANQNVSASEVLNTRYECTPWTDVTEIVGTFLIGGRSGGGPLGRVFERAAAVRDGARATNAQGEFYVYDRKKGSFWLLSLADSVFGGYSRADMLAENQGLPAVGLRAKIPPACRAVKG